MRYLFVLSVVCVLGQEPARDLHVTTAAGAKAALAAARQERRVALIIGNDAYPDAPLKNAVNDAQAIDKAVSELEQKFQTYVLTNATLKEMQRGVGLFVDGLQENDVAMIYYAGHGIQLGDENYLVPVDFAAEDAAAAKFAAYNANELLERVGAKKPKLLMVLLDACRNNPFKVSRSMGTGGLAPVGAGVKGSIIVLSTAPGKTASDNPTGNNTYFNMAVVENLSKKGLDVNEMFNEVKRAVSGMSHDEQRPWTNSDFAGRWYFHPPDDFLPPDVDPAVSERLYRDALAAAGREDYAAATKLFDQVSARETDSPMGVAAAGEGRYLRLLGEAQKDAPGEISAAHAGKLAAAWEFDRYRAAAYGLAAAGQRLALGDGAAAVVLLTRLRASANDDVAFRARKMLTALAGEFPAAGAALAAAVQPELVPAVVAGMPESRFRKLAEEMAQEAARRAAEKAAAGPVAEKGGKRIKITALSVDEPVGEAPLAEVAPAVPAKKNAPKQPLIQITSSPAGAAVSFGEPGVAPCVTPCEFRAPAGRYTAALSLPGYRRELRILAAAMPGAELAVEMALKQGKVMLECETPVETVELGGKAGAGQCPGEVMLAPGEYELTLWDETVRLQKVMVRVVDQGMEKARFGNR